MTFHTRIDVQRLFLPTGPERVGILEQKLDAERRVYRESPPDSYNHSTASRNIDDLEAALEQAERNELARAKNAAARQAERDAEQDKVEPRRQQEAAQLKEDLRLRYRVADRTATDEDFEKAYPSLLEDYRREKMAEDEEARRRMAQAYRL